MHEISFGKKKPKLSIVPKTDEQRTQLMVDVVGPPSSLPPDIDDIILHLTGNKTITCT